MEQIQKEFEDRVSIQEFLKYVERQEALNQGMLRTTQRQSWGHITVGEHGKRMGRWVEGAGSNQRSVAHQRRVVVKLNAVIPVIFIELIVWCVWSGTDQFDSFH